MLFFVNRKIDFHLQKMGTVIISKKLIKNIFLKIFLTTWLSILIITSCNQPQQLSPTFDEAAEQVLQTRQAQAIMYAKDTITAYNKLTTQPLSTNILEEVSYITQTLEPPTSIPTFTTPTLTPEPSQSIIRPTWTYDINCNLARLVQSVTIPDGTIMLPGEKFTKIWRIQNIGTCTWTTDYKITFVTGNQLGAESTYNLPNRVRPGERIDIAVPMITPTEKGTYAGHWMLCNESGGRFGVGSGGKSTFWVGINVIADLGGKFDFSNELCDATWTSVYGSTKITLPCPGSNESIKNGYVIRALKPDREDGGLENELGMITHPNNQDGGYVQGKYPAITVNSGDKFKSVVNCQYESPACDVYFELRYQIGTGSVQSLGRWHQVYDGVMESVEVDLSSLAGKSVNFILYVENGASLADNRALWIRPSIWE